MVEVSTPLLAAVETAGKTSVEISIKTSVEKEKP